MQQRWHIIYSDHWGKWILCCIHFVIMLVFCIVSWLLQIWCMWQVNSNHSKWVILIVDCDSNDDIAGRLQVFLSHQLDRGLLKAAWIKQYHKVSVWMRFHSWYTLHVNGVSDIDHWQQFDIACTGTDVISCKFTRLKVYFVDLIQDSVWTEHLPVTIVV